MRTRLFRWLDKQLSAQYQLYPVLKRGEYQTHPNISLHSYAQSETISYSHPHHSGDLLPEYSNTIGNMTYPAPFILDIQQGKISGRHALVTTDDNQIIAESVFNHLPYIEALSSGRLHYPQTPSEFLRQLSFTAHYDSVFVLANYFGNAFYHWILESLPRLWLWQEYQHMTGQSLPVLLTHPLPEFAQQTLDILGVKDVIFWDATRAEVKQLVMPMAVNGTGIPSRPILEQVSEQLIANIANLPQFDNPRIYITRKNSPKRRVINEDEVLALLEKHGFEVFALETLSLTEQIALFQQAEIVIGAHGAGFANCIHSKNIKLLEFFEPSYINICFYRLACAFGFDYGYLVGQSQGLNISVDVAELESMMREMKII